VQGESACKPASVPPEVPRGWRPSIWDRRCRRPRAAHQGTRPGQPPRPAAAGRYAPNVALLRVGFAKPAGHPAAGARLPHRFTLATRPLPGRSAVCSLWHCPAGRPDWRLASTLPCGGRTFLDPGSPRDRGRPADSPLHAFFHREWRQQESDLPGPTSRWSRVEESNLASQWRRFYGPPCVPAPSGWVDLAASNCGPPGLNPALCHLSFAEAEGLEPPRDLPVPSRFRGGVLDQPDHLQDERGRQRSCKSTRAPHGYVFDPRRARLLDSSMVPAEGLEPPRPRGHQSLKLARLPVPPGRDDRRDNPSGCLRAPLAVANVQPATRPCGACRRALVRFERTPRRV
jgi:hypothetical protein